MKVAHRVTMAYLTFAVLSTIRAESAPTTLYVATNGNNAWSGKLAAPNKAKTDGPLASLERARDAVREEKMLSPAGLVRIVIRGGTYFLTEPFVLTPEDSGTAERPIEYCAYPGEKPIISAGVPVTGFRKAVGKLWVADVAPDKVKGFDLRQLRVGEERQLRSRTPNFVPRNPYSGGWFFTRFPPDYTEKGFGTTVACIHNVGDFLEWEIEVPMDGEYRWSFYYGAFNKPFGRDNMDGHTQVAVDGGVPQLLQNLPDTGGWNTFKWSDTSATFDLTKGKHLFRWKNNKGGGLNLDAFILTDDPNYKPEGIRLAPPAAGKHALLTQCENFKEGKGPELQITKAGAVPAYNDHFCFLPGEVKAWKGIEDAEIYVFPAWGWVSTRVGIQRVDEAKATVWLDPPGSEQEIRIGNRFYIENVREALDAPGEWFFDRAENRLYYFPPSPDFEKKGVMLALHDRAVRLNGDPATGRCVEYVTFRGIIFADTSYAARPANVYYPEDAAVWLDGANHCTIRDCRFLCVGGYAVKLNGKSNNNRIVGNDIAYPGEGGVFIGDVEKIGPSGNLVSGNTIHHGGCHYAHVGGVYMRTSNGNTISHNLIHHMPRYGISWKSGSANNIVEFNELHFLDMETNDTGAIECWTSGRGNIIRNNLITDVVGLKHIENDEKAGIVTPTYTWGIYLDDMSSGTIVENNIVARTCLGGVDIHGGGDNVITNNIFVDGSDFQIYYSNYGEGDKNNIVTRNVFYWTKPEATVAGASGFGVKVLKDADYNLYWSAKSDAPTDPKSYVVQSGGPRIPFPEWQSKGFDTHSVFADPLFVDAKHDNFALRPDSPALKLGFRPIDTTRIGLKGYRPPE